MTGAPEFARPHRLDRIGEGAQDVAIEADARERAALAARFDLAAVDRLEASFALRRGAGGIEARGRVRADVVQRCIATDEPVPATIDETVELRFLREPTDAADEVELGEEEVDTIFYSGGAIDLGEAAAQTMALALDPFPRSAEAEAALRAAGVVEESDVPAPEPSPRGLAGLRDLLGDAEPSRE